MILASGKWVENIEDIKKALGDCDLYADCQYGEYFYCGYKDLESTICEAFERIEVYEEDIEEDTEFECLEIHACRYITVEDIATRNHDVLENIAETMQEDFGIEEFDYSQEQEKLLGEEIQKAIKEWAKKTKVIEERYYISLGRYVYVPYELAKKITDENTIYSSVEK